MSIFAGPEINEDGLLVYLDAENDRCYPGSGTTWTDLSNSGYGGSLIGSTSFSTSPRKFDTNATLVTENYYISTASQITLSDTSAYSFEFVVKLRSGATSTFYSLSGRGSTNPWLSLYANDTTGDNWYIRYRESGGTYRNFSAITDYNIQNNWGHIALTFDSSRNINFYLNGVFRQTLSTATSTLFYVSRLAGGYSSGGNFYNFQGSMAIAKLYTKTLSAAEVSQNFQAIRGRFSI